MAQRHSTTRQTIAHFDTPTGIAGDMTIGALLDVGGSRAALTRAVRALALPGVHVHARVERHQKVSGTNFTVKFSERTVRSGAMLPADTITTRFRRAKLPEKIRATCVCVWQRILDADACVQRISPRALAYPMRDAFDFLIDIAGAANLFAAAEFTQISVSPLPVVPSTTQYTRPLPPRGGGTGRGDAAPSLVARAILHGWPICESTVPTQLVTPTGAALMREFATHVGTCPLRSITREGRGFGDMQLPHMVNAVHLLIGEGAPLLCLEANVDDCNPEVYDYLITCLLRAGAIDVTIRPVRMKKRRPGVLVQVLCEHSVLDALTRVIMRETTSFGVRSYPVERTMLRRERVPVQLGRDLVHVKLGWLGAELLQVSPEYDDCQRIAHARGLSLREIYQRAVLAVQPRIAKK